MSDPAPHLSSLIDELRQLCENYDAATARAALDSLAAKLGLSDEQRAGSRPQFLATRAACTMKPGARPGLTVPSTVQR